MHGGLGLGRVRAGTKCPPPAASGVAGAAGSVRSAASCALAARLGHYGAGLRSTEAHTATSPLGVGRGVGGIARDCQQRPHWETLRGHMRVVALLGIALSGRARSWWCPLTLATDIGGH